MGDPYEQTTYQCDLIAVRVGQRHPKLDQLLRCNDLRDWAFVTAWNRNGVVETISSNQQGNEQLLEEAKQKGLKVIVGADCNAEVGTTTENDDASSIGNFGFKTNIKSNQNFNE